MNRILKLIRWFIKEEKGSVLVLASSSIIISTMALFFFKSITTLSVKSKERITHLHNATVIGLSIDRYISTYLMSMGIARLNSIDSNEPQFTATRLSELIGISNNEILSLEDLEKDGQIMSHNDPTAVRTFKTSMSYDKRATKVKVIFKLNSEDKVEDIQYLVNLAGPSYENNAPYDNSEPFFYIVSFNDELGNGDYGEYDLIDNDITLVNANGDVHESVITYDTINFHNVVVLPEDNE